MKQLDDSKAVVLFSGGQDSTTLLGIALKAHAWVMALSFNYGQRHKIELHIARELIKQFRQRFPDVQLLHVILPLDIFHRLGGNALVDIKHKIETNKETGLPTTFVPGRNIIFAIVGAIVAYQQNAKHLYLGVSAIDYSGYPDCRPDTMDLLNQTLRCGMDADLVFHTPLLNLSKAQEWELADKLGIFDIVEQSQTCYRGERPGCGECPACKLRQKGYEDFKAGKI